MFGIYLLSGGNLSELAIGDYLTIICAIFAAAQILIIARYISETNRPIAMSTIQFITACFLSLLIALSIEDISWNNINDAAIEILYAGIFSSGLAFTLQIIAMRYTTAPQAAILLSSEALFAALFGSIILEEKLSFIAWIGCGLLFSAILLVELIPALQKQKNTRV